MIFIRWNCWMFFIPSVGASVSDILEELRTVSSPSHWHPSMWWKAKRYIFFSHSFSLSLSLSLFLLSRITQWRWCSNFAAVSWNWVCPKKLIRYTHQKTLPHPQWIPSVWSSLSLSLSLLFLSHSLLSQPSFILFFKVHQIALGIPNRVELEASLASLQVYKEEMMKSSIMMSQDNPTEGVTLPTEKMKSKKIKSMIPFSLS